MGPHLDVRKVVAQRPKGRYGSIDTSKREGPGLLVPSRCSQKRPASHKYITKEYQSLQCSIVACEDKYVRARRQSVTQGPRRQGKAAARSLSIHRKWVLCARTYRLAPPGGSRPTSALHCPPLADHLAPATDGEPLVISNPLPRLRIEIISRERRFVNVNPKTMPQTSRRGGDNISVTKTIAPHNTCTVRVTPVFTELRNAPTRLLKPYSATAVPSQTSDYRMIPTPGGHFRIEFESTWGCL
ncbi:hypothetical protein J6590_052442 [Homalodisca vitripennis]|nr:hypothetical protein J6590_052442 [Homalodisca vitripennis]